MRKIYPISILFLLLLSKTNSYAQNFVEDFKKINEIYTSGIDMSYTYSYYNYYKSIKPDNVIKGQIKSYKNMYRIVMGDIEIINGRHLKVIADHKGKTLTLDSADLKQMSDYSSENTIEKLTSNYEKVEYIDKGSLATYKIYSNNGLTVYSEITVYKSSFIIESIGIYFMDKRDDFRKGGVRNKLIINYSNVKTGIKIPDSDFSIDKFIYYRNNEFKLNADYKQYEFVNMVSK